MASSATFRDQRRSAAVLAFAKPVSVPAKRPWAPVFFRVTLAIVALWTFATLLWAIDPAFLVHIGNLLTGLVGSAATRV